MVGSVQQTAALLVITLVIGLAPASAEPLGARVQRVFDSSAGTFPGRAGMAFVDLQTAERASIRGDVVFEAASLVKVGILVEVMEQVKSGRLPLTEKMVLREADKTGGSGRLKNMPAGAAVTIEQLADWMITISDNTATDMLIRRLGMATVERRLQALGLSRTHLRRRIMDFAAIDRGLDNVTSPLDMARLLGFIARHAVADPAGCERMIAILKRQKRRHIIAAALPKGTAVASKTGELTGIIHDVGIVYAPRGAYVLALLGSDVSDPEAARAVFRKVSGAVYRAYMKPLPTGRPGTR